MAKQLNQWLDEFIENGADASDVTNWPENAGGSDGGEVIIAEKGPDDPDPYYSIDVDELLTLVENLTGSIYSFGDRYEIDGSGGKGVEGCIILDIFENNYIIKIGDDVIATVEKSSFSSWYNFINDNKTIIEQINISLSLTQAFVGVIRESNHDITGKFNISKLLKRVEEPTE